MTADLILLKSDTLGDANRDLGAVLMEVFLRNLAQREDLPKCMVLLNAAVHLAAADSPVLEHLKKLEARGVEIVCCRTCVDYFQIQDRIAVGQIDGMVGILGRLSNSTVLSL
ncbi:MAG: transcriptional regulator [Armatimonadota bacterium]|nr:transcriptional regulator [Armatimonadota bacterium]